MCVYAVYRIQHYHLTDHPRSLRISPEQKVTLPGSKVKFVQIVDGDDNNDACLRKLYWSKQGAVYFGTSRVIIFHKFTSTCISQFIFKLCVNTDT